jgi:hypothetical protein
MEVTSIASFFSGQVYMFFHILRHCVLNIDIPASKNIYVRDIREKGTMAQNSSIDSVLQALHAEARVLPDGKVSYGFTCRRCETYTEKVLPDKRAYPVFSCSSCRTPQWLDIYFHTLQHTGMSD